MFVLSNSEPKILISRGIPQNVIPSKYNTGGADIMAFTELGVAMLSSVFMEAIKDLSEDNQNEFDNIYLALSELAVKLKKSQDSARNKIGFR